MFRHSKVSIQFQLVTSYPFVSKTLREAGKPKSDKRSHRCCAMTIQSEGIGYDDLNDLMKNPQSLEFTIGEFFFLQVKCGLYRGFFFFFFW